MRGPIFRPHPVPASSNAAWPRDPSSPTHPELRHPHKADGQRMSSPWPPPSSAAGCTWTPEPLVSWPLGVAMERLSHDPTPLETEGTAVHRDFAHIVAADLSSRGASPILLCGASQLWWVPNAQGFARAVVTTVQRYAGLNTSIDWKCAIRAPPRLRSTIATAAAYKRPASLRISLLFRSASLYHAMPASCQDCSVKRFRINDASPHGRMRHTRMGSDLVAVETPEL